MENADLFLKNAALIALYIFSLSLIFPFFRLFKGPTLPDRIVALDQIGVIIIGMMICDVLYAREKLLLDVVLVVAFILAFGSMIIARYLYKQKKEQ
ncbi:monovalent cation/H+ antiporter complex subunit F [Marinilabilia rubra]|uniref:Cation:proton antiporter n=1 Tax=Marinilabilia rubra TaxID=2162893 RepID=A0A2U2BCM1_9BACT|nr:monovalent cation/H+ antiporter complex subunit F [Marinilabilia rubra]PWE00777.1 cation:proton antiporter [Marinilabilia rubra]